MTDFSKNQPRWLHTLTHSLSLYDRLLPALPNAHSALFYLPNCVPFIPFFRHPASLYTLQGHFSSSEFHLLLLLNSGNNSHVLNTC